MARLIENTVVLVKTESTYNTAPASMTGADAVEVFDFQHTPRKINYQSAKPARGYRGAAVDGVGTQSSDVSFSVNLAGSGAAGTAPAFGQILQSCGLAKTVTADELVEYTPGALTGDTSLYMKHYADGLLYPTGGLRGTFDFKATMGDIARLAFNMQGLPVDESTASNPTGDFSDWMEPVIITSENADDVSLGCTYAAGALTGGTSYSGQGLEFSAGNTVAVTHLTGGSEVNITDRETTGKVTLELTAAQELAMQQDINAGTLQSLGYTIGTADGYKFGVFFKKVQLKNLTVQNVNGRRLITLEFKAIPEDGNDEYTIWFK